jgi:hypothetical protein
MPEQSDQNQIKNSRSLEDSGNLNTLLNYIFDRIDKLDRIVSFVKNRVLVEQSDQAKQDSLPEFLVNAWV